MQRGAIQVLFYQNNHQISGKSFEHIELYESVMNNTFNKLHTHFLKLHI